MGHKTKEKCVDCGHVFTTRHGGGFLFDLLRCKECGQTKAVSFDSLGTLHARYVKGLTKPYCMATADHDRQVQGDVLIDAITEAEYHHEVEEAVGPCLCGGTFSFDASLRCPKCRSINVRNRSFVSFYD